MNRKFFFCASAGEAKHTRMADTHMSRMKWQSPLLLITRYIAAVPRPGAVVVNILHSDVEGKQKKEGVS